MQQDTRNKLKEKIRVAASLTNHQAGKVTGAVLAVLSEKDERIQSFIKENEYELVKKNSKRKRIPKLKKEPSFELIDESLPFDPDTTNKETYVVLSKDQFDLIKKPLLGSIQTANNQQLNSLRKYMDKPEAVQKILKDILTVSELASKLDKLS